jgi:hypothetical protein
LVLPFTAWNATASATAGTLLVPVTAAVPAEIGAGMEKMLPALGSARSSNASSRREGKRLDLRRALVIAVHAGRGLIADLRGMRDRNDRKKEDATIVYPGYGEDNRPERGGIPGAAKTLMSRLYPFLTGPTTLPLDFFAYSMQISPYNQNLHSSQHARTQQPAVKSLAGNRLQMPSGDRS